MMRSVLLPAAALAAALAAAACDAGAPAPPTEAQLDARRDACLGEEMLIRARERRASLDTVLARTDPSSPTMAFTLPAHEFAVILERYADLRHRETAYLDSASRAATEADSARYAALAAQHTIPPTPAGSLAYNVRTQYEGDFTAARANPAHACNRERAEAAGGA